MKVRTQAELAEFRQNILGKNTIFDENPVGGKDFQTPVFNDTTPT